MHIILATSNKHKIKEFEAMIATKNVESSQDSNAKVLSYEDIIAPIEVDENGFTFKANATIKLQSIYRALFTHINALDSSHALKASLINAPLAIIAEDSGLCVEALNGEPGIYSARYAKMCGYKGEFENIDKANLACLIDKINALDSSNAPFRAHFQAHIAMILLDSIMSLPPLESISIMHFEGICKGRVIGEARGANGFGYDPIFIPDSNNPSGQTLAECDSGLKNAISHRKMALDGCLDYIFATQSF